MSDESDIDAAILFLDEVVKPYLEEQRRQSTAPARDIPDGHIWREQRRPKSVYGPTCGARLYTEHSLAGQRREFGEKPTTFSNELLSS
jgi:hypothetical protein